MDAHQLHGQSITASDTTSSSSSSSPSSYSLGSSVPSRLLGSLKLDSKNSPNSHFSPLIDCDITTLSDNLELESNFFCLPFDASSCVPRMSLEVLQNNLDHQPAGAWLRQETLDTNLALQQLETALMEPDDDEAVRTTGHLEKRQRMIEHPPIQKLFPGDLKRLLLSCAVALDERNFGNFDRLIECARTVVSIRGEPIQRLGAYLVEGLVARKESSGACIYRALRCREPDSKDLLSYMEILYEICPYLKFGYMAANGAIADACKNEERIHIVDFQIAQGTQWLTLLQALAARPGGAPRVRITGIDDPVSMYAHGDGMETVGKRLAAVSQKFNIPVEFHALRVFPSNVRKEMLRVRNGEALVVNFPLQLHHAADESVDVDNPRDGLLRMVKALNPKVTTLVEQESNTNTAPFLARFEETLEYYLAMFASIDVALPRDRKERIGVEQQCLARDIVNVIACEGRDRAERHELFGKWKSRFTMAGFRPYPLNCFVNSVIRGLLRCYSDRYTLTEKEGALLLGWNNRNLISASAWC